MGKLVVSVLSEEEIHQIHQNTLRVLSDTGFSVGHAETLELFRKLGAVVDDHSGIIQLSGELVDHLLASAPAVALLGGLNGRTLAAGGDSVHYTSLILDPFVVDWEEGVRQPVLADVKRNTIIGESLERVSIMMRMQYPVEDVPEPDSYYRTMETFMLNMTKHISAYPDTIENCRDWIAVTETAAVASGRPSGDPSLLSIAMAVISPLRVNAINIEIMKLAMDCGAPILATVCPMAGSTAPFSVAGTFLQANVEALIPVLIAQAYKPGHPVFYGVGPSITDMHSGKDLYYRAEKMLFKVMANQMSRFYGLPSSGEAGGSLSCQADPQNGAESLAYLLASHAWKQNIIGGLGSFGNANGMSSEQIVMQCGLIDMAEYLSRGVDFSNGKDGLAAIARTGPGGNFLTDDLTLTLLRDSDEFFHTPYMDLSGEPSDPGQGKSMPELAHQKVLDLERSFNSSVPDYAAEQLKRFFYDRYQDKMVSKLD